MNSITTALLEHYFLTSGPQSESIDSFYWGRRFWFCSLPVLSILTWIQSRYSCFSRPETGCWFSSVGWAIHRVQLLTHRAKPDAAHLYVVFAGSRIAQGQSPTRFCPCIFFMQNVTSSSSLLRQVWTTGRAEDAGSGPEASRSATPTGEKCLFSQKRKKAESVFWFGGGQSGKSGSVRRAEVIALSARLKSEFSTVQSSAVRQQWAVTVRDRNSQPVYN